MKNSRLLLSLGLAPISLLLCGACPDGQYKQCPSSGDVCSCAPKKGHSVKAGEVYKQAYHRSVEQADAVFSPPLMAQAIISVRKLVPVRLYLAAKDIPPQGIGAYGIVALRGLPTPATRGRLSRLCQSFVKYLPPDSAIPRSVPQSDRMATIWPLINPDAEDAKNDKCDYVIDHYDLYGGISAIEDATAQGATLTGPGPFLIGWSPSADRGVKDKVVLVFDMSSLDSQDSFDRAFIWWQQKVVSNPKLWRNGWSVEEVRLSVRDFFDKYAPSALSALNFFGDHK